MSALPQACKSVRGRRSRLDRPVRAGLSSSDEPVGNTSAPNSAFARDEIKQFFYAVPVAAAPCSLSRGRERTHTQHSGLPLGSLFTYLSEHPRPARTAGPFLLLGRPAVNKPDVRAPSVDDGRAIDPGSLITVTSGANWPHPHHTPQAAMLVRFEPSTSLRGSTMAAALGGARRYWSTTKERFFISASRLFIPQPTHIPCATKPALFYLTTRASTHIPFPTTATHPTLSSWLCNPDLPCRCPGPAPRRKEVIGDYPLIVHCTVP